MGRPRKFDENEVLDAVGATFQDHGYTATSLDDIMQASGLGKGSLYAAFGDKYSLFRRVFDNYCSTVAQSMSNALDGPDDTALQRLQSLLERAAHRSGDSAAPLACFLAKSTAELAASDPEVAARSRRAFTELADSITGCIAQAQRAGDIDSRSDPRRLGNHILVTLRGIEALVESGSSARMLDDAASVALEVLRSPAHQQQR